MTPKHVLAAIIVAGLFLAFAPNAAAGILVSECVDGDQICVCASDLNASCYDAHSDQSDCRIAYGSSTQHWNGFMCGAIVDLPEGRASPAPALAP